MATELKEMARELVNGADAGMLMQRLKARYQLSYVSHGTSVSFMPVAYGRAELPTTSAVVEGGEANILWQVMNVPKIGPLTAPLVEPLRPCKRKHISFRPPLRGR